MKAGSVSAVETPGCLAATPLSDSGGVVNKFFPKNEKTAGFSSCTSQKMDVKCYYKTSYGFQEISKNFPFYFNFSENLLDMSPDLCYNGGKVLGKRFFPCQLSTPL